MELDIDAMASRLEEAALAVREATKDVRLSHAEREAFNALIAAAKTDARTIDILIGTLRSIHDMCEGATSTEIRRLAITGIFQARSRTNE